MTRIVEWNGATPNLDDEKQFYFKINGGDGTTSAWSDGGEESGTLLTSNLETDVEDLLWIGEDGILRLQGYEQSPLPPEYPNGAPSVVSYTSGDLTMKLNQQRWVGGIASAEITGLNKNIGFEESMPDTTPFTANAPWTYKVNSMTSYKGF